MLAVDLGVEAFLYREARLMDEGRYDEWLALWNEDGRYWIPCNDEDIDPATHVSIIYDSYTRLVQRVERLKSGTVQALEPRPRMRRLISNIEITDSTDVELTVESNFMLGIARNNVKDIWIGRSIHRLRRTGDGFTIAEKKVLLIDLDQEIRLLQFLV
jgi:3-phenylpropionate/cinnamic acid dioxygenase small subunit